MQSMESMTQWGPPWASYVSTTQIKTQNTRGSGSWGDTSLHEVPNTTEGWTGRGYEKAWRGQGETQGKEGAGGGFSVSGSKTLAEVGAVWLGRGGEKGRSDYRAWRSAVQAPVAPGAKEGVIWGAG